MLTARVFSCRVDAPRGAFRDFGRIDRSPDGFSLQRSGCICGDIAMRLSDNADPDETGWSRVRAKARNEVTSLAEILQTLTGGRGVMRVRGENLWPAAIEVVRVFVETSLRLAFVSICDTPQNDQPPSVAPIDAIT